MPDYKVSASVTGNASSFQKAFAIANDAIEKFETKISHFSEKIKAMKQSLSITDSANCFQEDSVIVNDAIDEFNAKTSCIPANIKNIDKSITNMGKSFTNVGGKITKFVTTPAMGAVTALTSLTLVKGFNRLKGIDDAKAKLKGLGHDAQAIEDIMNSALASVKGTSYGMDEAATTAASAVAAGIKPGKELTRYLSLTADAAAEAGASMSDMGSIINKVQTSQVAYTDNLNQLADRGLPIYQWLADEANTTAANIKEMAKDGEISSEMFLNAIEKNIGGAAKIIGENSFKASVENIGASISRIGANFLDAGGKGGGFFSTLKPLLVDFNNDLGVLETKAAELGEKFGAAFGDGVAKLQEIKSKFDALSPSMQNTVMKSAGVGAALLTGLGPGVTAAGKVLTVTGTLTGGIDKAASAIAGSSGKIKGSFDSLKTNATSLIGDFKNLGGGLIQPIEPLVTKVSGIVKGGLSNVGKAIASPFKKGFSLISNGLGDLVGNFRTKFPALTDAIGAFESNSKGMFSRIGGSMQGILQKAAGFAPMFLKGFGIAAGVGVIVAGLGLLQDNFGGSIDNMIRLVVEKGPEIITNFCNGITSALPNLIAQGGTLIMNLLNAVTANLPAVLSGGVSILCALVDGVSKTLPYLIPTALDLVLTLVDGIITNLPQIVESGLNLILSLADGIIAAIPNLIQKAPIIIGNLVSGIVKMLPKIITTGITLITNLAVGLIQAIPKVIEAIPKIIDNIKGAFAEFEWGEIGKNIIDGIKNGLSNVAPKLIQAAKDTGKAALNAIKDILGIHSPSRVFRDEVGQMMALGLGIGFEANIPVKAMKGSVASAVKDLTAYSALPSADMKSTGIMMSTNRMIEDVSISYGQSVAQSNATNYQPTDINGLGDYIVAVSANQMQAIADALEKGIASQKLMFERREVGRMMSDMGFVRV